MKKLLIRNIIMILALISSLIFMLTVMLTGLTLALTSFGVKESLTIDQGGHTSYTDSVYEDAIKIRNELINSKNKIVSFIAKANNLVRFIIFIVSICLSILFIQGTKTQLKQLKKRLKKKFYFQSKKRKTSRG